MKNCKKYGEKPYKLAILHGGPGAAGEVSPLAEELSKGFNVLEPLQTKSSITEQIKELKKTLDKNAECPVQMIGWSWGAWLAYIFAATYPDYVSKLILISSGPFERKYAKDIMKTRMDRLDPADQIQLIYLFETFNKSPEYLKEIIELLSKADAYEHISHKEVEVDFNYAIYKSIWKEAEALRLSGKLLKYADKIVCPVVALHGDYDPHPYEGVILPLIKGIKDFKYKIFEKCGHHPWFELNAKDNFYQELRQELA